MMWKRPLQSWLHRAIPPATIGLIESYLHSNENEILADLVLDQRGAIEIQDGAEMMEEFETSKEAEQKDNWDLLDKHLSVQQDLKEAEKALASQLELL